jgi:hypothetical protein
MADGGRALAAPCEHTAVAMWKYCAQVLDDGSFDDLLRIVSFCRAWSLCGPLTPTSMPSVRLGPVSRSTRTSRYLHSFGQPLSYHRKATKVLCSTFSMSPAPCACQRRQRASGPLMSFQRARQGPPVLVQSKVLKYKQRARHETARQASAAAMFTAWYCRRRQL